MAVRQLGSLVKVYGYLAAFERGRDEGVALSPDTIVSDVPTVFWFSNRPWRPRNYAGQYGGSMTWRHALAQSKNGLVTTPSGRYGAESSSFDRSTSPSW